MKVRPYLIDIALNSETVKKIFSLFVFAIVQTCAFAQEKALDLIVPIIGKKRSAALLAALWDFENLKDVRVLRKLYQA